VPKILSQAGKSLADVYDVEGSIAGIDELLSKDVALVHEMGQTIFSERMSSRIIATSTGAISQSSVIDTEIPNLPMTPFRIHGINLTDAGSNTIARLSNIVVVLVSSDGIESIVWMWDGSVETQRMEGNVKAVLMPEIGFATMLPSLGMGGDQPATVPQLFARGNTPAFGAGTVNIAIRTHITFSQLEGVSSVGLPIPSW